MSRYYNDFSDSHSEALEHHGILGQKWGVRRYVNEDGTLTAEGRKKYGSGQKMNKKVWKQQIANAQHTQVGYKVHGKTIQKDTMNNTKELYNKYQKELNSTKEGQRKQNVDNFLNSARGGKYFQLDPSTAAYVNKINSDYARAGRKLYETKYMDEAAGTALRDLGYQDTRAGRDWITKQGYNKFVA